MNLFQAWLDWFSGRQLPEETLICAVVCGKLFIWARYGKILQFMSAITIIADIIGPEKIRETGRLMRQLPLMRTAKKYLNVVLGWYGNIFYKNFSGQSPDLDASFYIRKESESFIEHISRIFRKSYFDKANFLVSTILLIPWINGIFYLYFIQLDGVYRDYHFEQPYSLGELLWAHSCSAFSTVIFTLFIWIFNLAIVSPTLISVTCFLLVFFIIPCISVCLQGIAWMLERKQIENWIKVLSLLLFLVGFHFDLLAS